MAATTGNPNANQAIEQRDLPDEISLGEYLLERLYQLQVTSLFGVPGDFNLVSMPYHRALKAYRSNRADIGGHQAFLDLVEDHDSIKWVGNANELNAVSIR